MIFIKVYSVNIFIAAFFFFCCCQSVYFTLLLSLLFLALPAHILQLLKGPRASTGTPPQPKELSLLSSLQKPSPLLCPLCPAIQLSLSLTLPFRQVCSCLNCDFVSLTLEQLQIWTMCNAFISLSPNSLYKETMWASSRDPAAVSTVNIFFTVNQIHSCSIIISANNKSNNV